MVDVYIRRVKWNERNRRYADVAGVDVGCGKAEDVSDCLDKNMLCSAS
jgi:hypothetical protein